MVSQAVAHDHEIPFESRRVPLERRITLKFQHRDGFVNEYAANISLKGMFITAWVPEPPGSVFLFEVQVADRQRLIHGVGEVVWVREAEEGPDRPAGMGVRFLKLDEESRAVIEEMVALHVSRGGQPFDPSQPPEGIVAVDELFDGESETLQAATSGNGGAGEGEADAAAETSEQAPLAAALLDSRSGRPEGRAMARRGRGLLWISLFFLAMLAGSVLLVLLS